MPQYVKIFIFSDSTQVFNVARNSRTRSRPSAGPYTNIYYSSDNERHTNFQIVHKKLKLK